jgi:hypothetical protein
MTPVRQYRWAVKYLGIHLDRRPDMAEARQILKKPARPKCEKNAPVAPSIRKSWQSLHRQAAVARSV